MDRISKLLHGLDLEHGEGLEFGPLMSPILRRPGARVLYVDHLDTERLRAKYAGDTAVCLNDIVPVDIVWASGSLSAAVQASRPGGEVGFDHAVASHVIEHVPDVVWWLREVMSVLRPGGALRLIVPDRRFTMDIARRETVLADVLAAYLGAQRYPHPREILDYYCNYTAINCRDAWQGHLPQLDGCALQNADLAMKLGSSALAGEYSDVHCTVFTPRSLARLMRNLSHLNLLDFGCTRLFPTIEGELDFFVHLEAMSDPALIRDSWERAEADLATASPAEETLLQDDVVALRRRLEAFRYQCAGLTMLEDQLRAARRRADTLETELQQARLFASEALSRQRAVFEGSTSWRVTGPLRRFWRLASGTPRRSS